MKILVINDLLQGGGVEKLMYDIVMRFHNEHEITIFTDKRDEAFEQLYPDNVGYLWHQKEYPKGRNRIERKLIYHRKKNDDKRFIEKIEAMKFDVLLCMKEGWTMSNGIKFGKSIPKRIAWVHTDYSKSYYTWCAFQTQENEVKCMQMYHHVVCVSQVIVDSIKKVIGDPGNLVMQYNPLDKEEIVRKSLESVEDIQRSERPLFVTVGRLNIQKGYDVLLEVCNLLNAEGYQYDVWIVGGGESWNKYEVMHDLEDRIARYHLDNVYLLGHRDNPHKYVKQGDWFLSTSRYEGYSYVSQEAAIIGKALMLTDCSGVMELLGSNENGIVMENSYKGIYYAMRDAIKDKAMAERYTGKVEIASAEYYGEERFKAIERLFIA